ncbi:MAG: VOC family protein [Candidatus Sulfotelmatobacter sp.]
MNATVTANMAQTASIGGGALLHHIGIVVPQIRPVLEGFAASIGAQPDSEIIYDPLQEVSVAFMRPSTPGPAVELIEPAAENCPVSNLARSGGGLHHLCYEVNDLEAELEIARSHGGIVVRKPLPAVAFGGRRIAWVFTRYKLLLEYLEQRCPAEAPNL